MCSNLLPNSSKIKISFTLVKLLKLILYLELHEYFGLYYLQESDIEAFVTVSTVNEVIGTWNNKKRVEKLR